MADFVKWRSAFAVVALLLGIGTSAYAQNTPFTCTANAGVPPFVRAEGIAELVGDLILNCTGGTFTPAGQNIPQSSVTISLNTNITSRTYAGNLSEAILTIDEPFPSLSETPTPASAGAATGSATNQLGCQAINSSNCAIVSVGGGVGATGSYNGTAGHFNVFQGMQSGPGQVVWVGVPIDAPAANTRVIRITNVRANACLLGVSSTVIPTQISMFIAVNGFTINQPQQTVAFAQSGLFATNKTANYFQGLNINGTLLSSTAAPGQVGSIAVTATEGFASSFKVRNYAQLFTAGVSNATNGLSPSTVGFQNVLGFPYNTESGFVSSTPGISPNGSGTGAIGLADQGTQISFSVTNVGAGVNIFAPAWVSLVPAGGGAATGLAVLSGATFSGSVAPLVQVTVTGNTAAVTYEVWYSNPHVIESLSLSVSVAAISNPGQNLPATGVSQIAINLAPISTVQTTSTTDPVQRFCNVATPKTFFSITAGSVAISLSATKLQFGYSGQQITSPQTVALNFNPSAAVAWTASSNQSNITVSPASGAGNAILQITASPGMSGMITVTAGGATNSPQQIQVTLTTVYSAPPYGSFDTPVNNTTSVAGAVPVTGWALDSIQATNVGIWREPVIGETAQANGLVFIGNAIFVAGARPDVQATYPNSPFNYRAGWGYMLLTNFLPNASGSGASGSGTYKLHAIITNASGQNLDLGAHTITVDNVHAAKPFGTIDTPAQGGTVAGNAYVNFGWALTQNPYVIPMDGSIITVILDGVPVGHPAYNQYRSDVANLFPGLANSNGAVGFFYIDTTTLANGVHTISWNVFDNAGRGDGIGSRYITVANTGGGNVPAPDEPIDSANNSMVMLRRDFGLNQEPAQIAADERGVYSVSMEELDRIELQVGATRGYLLMNGEHRSLPVGSTLKGGIFYWHAGLGFLGGYPLVFDRPDGSQIQVHVHVQPKNYSHVNKQ